MVQRRTAHYRPKKQVNASPTWLRVVALDDSARIKYFLALINDNVDNTASASKVTAYLRESGSELKLVIGIEEHTRVEDVRDALPLIMPLRDRLLEFQGLEPWDPEVSVYLDLLEQHRNGASWAAMANRINADLLQGPLECSENGERQFLIDALGIRGSGIVPDELRDKVRNFRKSKWYKYVVKWGAVNLADDDDIPVED